MRRLTLLLIYIAALCCLPYALAANNLTTASHPLGLQELEDSLNVRYNPFSTAWSAPIRVRQMRVNGVNITIRTNNTLSGIVFSPDELRDLRRQISLWLLGNERGKVTVYTGRYELGELIPDRLQRRKDKYPTYDRHPFVYLADSLATPRPRDKYTAGLTGKTIALWPSHGTYYNYAQDAYAWQRATLWTTVEDLYSLEYTRLVTLMLENAGAVVLQPRARWQGPNFRLTADSVWALVDDHAGLEIGPSGMPRWAEAARYWLEEAGYPDTIWNKYNGEDDYRADLQSRGLWVNYLTGGSRQNPRQEGFGIPVDVCVAIHTDGIDAPDDTTIVGTLAIYTDRDDDKRTTYANGITRQINRDLADYVQTQVVEDLRATIAPEWTRRQLHNANYCESRYPVIPSVLIEVLSHKNFADMHYGLDPRFRLIASRAIYKGLLRYLHSQDGRKTIVQPLPVSAFRTALADAEQGRLVLSWQPTPDPLEPTADPTCYYLYIRRNDEPWTTEKLQHPHHTLTLERGTRYDFYVVAANAGGLSLPGETLSAYLAPNPNAPIGLIINGFTQTYGPSWFADSIRAGIVPGTFPVENRYSVAYLGEQHDFTRSHPWRDDNNCGWGMCYRDHQATFTVGNTYDYPVLHGIVLQRLGISYISASAAALDTLPAYDFVDLILGKQRASDTIAVIPTPLQNALWYYLRQGGRLLASGSYLGSGMAQPMDQVWAKNALHYTFYTPRATRSGQVLLADSATAQPLHIALRTEPNSDGLFAEAPESLRPTEGARRLAIYKDMRTPAAIFWTDTTTLTGQARTLVYGFPLEAATNFEEVYTYSLQRLLETTKNDQPQPQSITPTQPVTQ